MNRVTTAGLVLGLGLGGFLDGIVLHQILGWHHLVCTTETCQVETVAELKRQNAQDGMFHLGTWTLTVAGVSLLFKAARDPAAAWRGSVLFGAMVYGWGIFNFVEGLIDHHLLGIHHVRPGHAQQFLFDVLFLGSGVLFIVIGAVLVKRGSAAGSPHPRGGGTSPG